MARAFSAQIFYGAENLNLPTANQGVAAGTYSWTLDANGVMVLTNTAGVSTVKFILGLADIKRTYNLFPYQPGQGTVLNTNEFNSAFGTAAGGPSDPFSGIAAGTTGAVNPNSSSQFGTPQTPWGMAVIDVYAVYAVTTAALTTATVACNRARFQENGAYTLDTMLAASNVALTTTTSITTPHVQKVALAQPIQFEQADYSNVYVTLTIVTAATSLVSIYGLGIHVAAEFS